MLPIFSAFLILAVLSLQAPRLCGAADVLNSDTGVVRVYVENHRGEPVSKAMIYISDGVRSEVFESGDMGSVAMDLQEGKYSISSAVSEPRDGVMDRFASPEAYVRVNPNDTASVILTLYPVEDPIPDLSLSTLQKLGVADEVFKYTNN